MTYDDIIKRLDVLDWDNDMSWTVDQLLASIAREKIMRSALEWYASLDERNYEAYDALTKCDKLMETKE